MQTSVKTNHTLEEEINAVQQFLSNEEFRYHGKLSWECIVDPEVNTFLEIPNLLIQTFVEIAIKHGIFENQAGGRVDVSINKSNIGVLILISDNGIQPGYNREIQDHLKDKLRLLDQYLDLFNKKQSCQVSYQILNRSAYETNRTGTRVLITLKY